MADADVHKISGRADLGKRVNTIFHVFHFSTTLIKTPELQELRNFFRRRIFAWREGVMTPDRKRPG
jgi:hypothetical protein